MTDTQARQMDDKDYWARKNQQNRESIYIGRNENKHKHRHSRQKGKNVLRYTIEMVDPLSHWSSLQTFMLTIKKGLIVMLFHNTDTKTDLVHGTRNVVENMTKNHLYILIPTGMPKGPRRTPPISSFVSSDESLLVWDSICLQTLAKICFAIAMENFPGSLPLKSLESTLGQNAPLNNRCIWHSLESFILQTLYILVKGKAKRKELTVFWAPFHQLHYIARHPTTACRWFYSINLGRFLLRLYMLNK